jgi:hypothetical protein
MAAKRLASCETVGRSWFVVVGMGCVWCGDPERMHGEQAGSHDDELGARVEQREGWPS